MLHHGLTNRAAAALDQRKHPARYAAAFNRRMDRFCNNLTRAGMGGVAFDHDRTACRQRRRRVTTRNRECQRKVRRAKDGDRADRALHHGDRRARGGLAFGHGSIETPVEICTLFDMRREEAQLANGPAPLSFQTRCGQAAFLAADLGDFGAAGVDLIGDGVQKLGAGGAAGIAVIPKRRFGGFAGLVDQIYRPDREFMHRPMGRARAKAVVGGDPFASDQVFAMGGKGHRLSFHAGRGPVSACVSAQLHT